MRYPLGASLGPHLVGRCLCYDFNRSGLLGSDMGDGLESCTVAPHSTGCGKGSRGQCLH